MTNSGKDTAEMTAKERVLAWAREQGKTAIDSSYGIWIEWWDGDDRCHRRIGEDWPDAASKLPAAPAETPEPAVDWAKDEAVVRAAIPDAEICTDDKGDIWIESASLGPISQILTRYHDNDDAWASARQHPTVQAHQREHRATDPAQAVAGERVSDESLQMFVAMQGFAQAHELAGMARELLRLRSEQMQREMGGELLQPADDVTARVIARYFEASRNRYSSDREAADLRAPLVEAERVYVDEVRSEFSRACLLSDVAAIRLILSSARAAKAETGAQQ